MTEPRYVVLETLDDLIRVLNGIVEIQDLPGDTPVFLRDRNGTTEPFGGVGGGPGGVYLFPMSAGQDYYKEWTK